MRPSLHEEFESSTELPLESEKEHGITFEFKNVSFKYPTRDVIVLDQLNMKASFTRFMTKTSLTNTGSNRLKPANLLL